MQKAKDKSPLNNAAQQMINSAPREGTNDSKRQNLQEAQQKIEELTNEIQLKDMTILGYQRNCEALSLVHKQEKEKSLGWTEKIGAMEKENSALKTKILTLENQKTKVLKDLEKAQEEIGKFYRNAEEYRSCRLENQTIKSLLEKKKKEVEELTRKLEICKGESDALKKVKVDLGANLKKVESDYECLKKERPELLDEIDRLRNECDEILIEMNKKQASLEDNYKELNVVKAREHKYFTELSAIKTSLNAEKDELYATRAKLVELYEHYKLLEDQIETKQALLKLADHTEKELKQKVISLEKVIKDKQESMKHWSNEKETTTQLLDQANREIEKLLIENESLKENEQNRQNYHAAFVYLVGELEKVVRWYDVESTKLGKQNNKLEIPSEPFEEKMEKILLHLSTIFSESLLIMKHYEELNQRYNTTVIELHNTRNKQSSASESDEIIKLNDIVRAHEGTIEELKKKQQSLIENFQVKNLENEKFRIELDIAVQKIHMMEKELKLKSAMIAQYEQKFSGDPDELLSRIEQLKNELESFSVNKNDSKEGKDKELQQTVGKISHALESIVANLSCNNCLNVFTDPVIQVPCGHVTCARCASGNSCKDCKRPTTQNVRISLVDEFSSKVTYMKQALADIELMITL